MLSCLPDNIPDPLAELNICIGFLHIKQNPHSVALIPYLYFGMSSQITLLLGKTHQIPQKDQVLFYGDFMAVAKPIISVNLDTGVSERFVRTVQTGSGLHMPGSGIYGVYLRANLATTPIIKANLTYTISGSIAPYTGQIIPNFYCSEIIIASTQMEDWCERRRPVAINAWGTILSVSAYQSKWEGGGFIYEVTIAHALTSPINHTMFGKYIIESTRCIVPDPALLQVGCHAVMLGELDGISWTTGQLLIIVTDLGVRRDCP
ncbi:hypothetical protein PTTG_12761 [Puccinia triticina 1-1 BBBD Race 1]|uniref:Uncharacterized protein n=1 Tax=Puccinia triticina (isolate 1-1 / race 1 (BBBD)) TaxID=630390 RepID=A0A180G1Y5_PUCT1|nr:hypothetical protein PTTG_12761 [Puccinia triticina 1-1 BBBD Race 1]